MKNIIICGSPRSGKSTFARMLLNSFKGYSLLSEEAIWSAYVKTCMDNDITNIDLYNMNLLIKNVYEYSIKYEPKLNFILDSSNLSIDDCKKYQDNGFLVLIFGYPDLSKTEALKNIYEHDDDSEWSFYESSTKLSLIVENSIEESKINRKKCDELGMQFINTSKNRNKVLNQLLEWCKINNK